MEEKENEQNKQVQEQKSLNKRNVKMSNTIGKKGQLLSYCLSAPSHPFILHFVMLYWDSPNIILAFPIDFLKSLVNREC